MCGVCRDVRRRQTSRTRRIPPVSREWPESVSDKMKLVFVAASDQVPEPGHNLAPDHRRGRRGSITPATAKASIRSVIWPAPQDCSRPTRLIGIANFICLTEVRVRSSRQGAGSTLAARSLPWPISKRMRDGRRRARKLSCSPPLRSRLCDVSRCPVRHRAAHQWQTCRGAQSRSPGTQQAASRGASDLYARAMALRPRHASLPARRAVGRGVSASPQQQDGCSATGTAERNAPSDSRLIG
jgi:hypothetical protein